MATLTSRCFPGMVPVWRLLLSLLGYVDLMRQALYAAADEMDRLAAERDPDASTRRYNMVVNSDDYSGSGSLYELAKLLPDTEVEWNVRSDAQVSR